MRTIIILSLFAVSLAGAREPDYTEERELNTPVNGASEFRIDAGAGSLAVTGVDGLDSVEVMATIGVDGVRNDDKARELLEKRLTLELKRRGDTVVLVSDFDGGMWRGGREAWVQLVVRMPSDLALSVDDGSGSINIDNVRAAVRIDDGSGSIKIRTVGSLEIDDGSGSIVAEDVTGDVDIIDGSGSITVAGVTGSVTIDDGSGSINVSDVQENLKIEDAGSGSVNIKNVAGSVETDG